MRKAKILITYELSKELEAREKNIPVKYFHRYAQSENVWGSIISKSKEWIETWPKQSIYQGKSALEILGFEDTSLWWFVYDALWETKNGIFDSIYQLKTLTALIEEFNPNEIEIYGIFDYPIIEMLEALAEKYGIVIKDQGSLVKQIPQTDVNRIYSRSKFVIGLTILKIASFFSKKTSSQLIFFSTHDEIIKKNKDNKITILDHYLVGLEDFFEKNKNLINFISTDKIRLFSISPRKLLSDFNRILNGCFTPWVCYYSISNIIKWWKSVKRFSFMISKLENDSTFQKSMVVDNINIYPFVRHVFVGNLPRALALVELDLKTSSEFFSKKNIETVFITDGISPSGRALCFEANAHDVNVITPQLGIISPQFPVNIGFLIGEEFDKRMLPKYLVWGQHFKKLIESKGYPSSKIKQVGFWRLDKDHTETNSSDYVLYIAGANLRKLDYILSFEEEIFTIKQILKILPKNLKLLVKLHPSIPFDLYQKKLKNLDKLVLVGNEPGSKIIELVKKAKVVVGKASTVIVQALILNKPVIVTNFASNVDFLGFEGIPFTTSLEGFSNILEGFVKGKVPVKNKIKNYCNPLGDKSVSLIIQELIKNDNN